MFKVLVVEDERPIREMYIMKLQSAGFVTKGAVDGRDGLEVVEAFRPDLILLDIRMPHMSGDDMLEELRKTDWGSEIKVVILTNLSKDEAPQKLRLLNVERYIVKAHYTPAQVVDIVREVMDQAINQK